MSACTAASITLTGCKADQASQAASRLDAAARPAHATGAPSAPVPEQPTPREPDARPLIVCFGDSLTAGLGADDGATYPDFLQIALNRDGFRYRVVNEGISGNTTKDGVDRVAGIVALKPQVVVLEFGGNDGLRGLRIDTTRNNLGQMIAALKAGGAQVVLAGISLPPDYGHDYIAKFNANYPALGRKYAVPVLPFLLQDVYGVPGMMQADNTHATDRGNEVVARNVLAYVEPLLHR